MKEGGLSSFHIANCVFNAFLSYTAIMLNSVMIHAIRKTSSLPKTLKTLLLSLTVADLSVGLLAQPLYVTRHIVDLEQNGSGNNSVSNSIEKVSLFTGIWYSLASFLGVMALSADRFLAIHLHLRYQELVTHNRVITVVILTWVLSAFLSVAKAWIPLNLNIIPLIYAILLPACLVTAACLSCKIFVTVRRHAAQLQAHQIQQVTQNGEIANFWRNIRSGIGAVYVYLVFFLCYAPHICIVISSIFAPTAELKDAGFYTLTLMFLNSSLNPLIYCCKMRGIRHAVVNIVRNLFSSHN